MTVIKILNTYVSTIYDKIQKFNSKKSKKNVLPAAIQLQRTEIMKKVQFREAVNQRF